MTITTTNGPATGGRPVPSQAMRDVGSSRGGTRTPDPVINSHLLYQLSYSGRGAARGAISPAGYRGSRLAATRGAPPAHCRNATLRPLEPRKPLQSAGLARVFA